MTYVGIALLIFAGLAAVAAVCYGLVAWRAFRAVRKSWREMESEHEEFVNRHFSRHL